jgi:hypothetical protein
VTGFRRHKREARRVTRVAYAYVGESTALADLRNHENLRRAFATHRPWAVMNFAVQH